MNNTKLIEYLEFAKEIAYEAGKIITKYFYEDNGEKYKYDQTIVTKADTEINQLLIDRVKEKYPNHSVDGEEEQFGKSDYVWVCDPVDGTAMYARHVPVAVFSLALVIDGVSTVGVVYDAFTDNLYYAAKGKGAYKNDLKIAVNNIELTDMRSIANMDMWPTADYNLYDVIKELGKKTYFVSLGSIIRACMCVANGDFNLAIFPGTKHKNCDIAAVKVIVEEAGGKVTDLFGNEQRYDRDINGAIISNSVVHDEVTKVLIKNLKEEQMKVDNGLKEYLEENIIPLYDNNYIGDGRDRIEYVLKRSREIIKENQLDINNDMLYAIICYHDIRKNNQEKEHELHSAEMMANDEFMKSFFTEEQRIIMKEAIEDQRAKKDTEPRNIYGKLLSSASRNSSVEQCLKRSYYYGKKKNPNATENQIFEGAYQALLDKFGENGYAKFYFKDSTYESFLKEIRQLLLDKNSFIENHKKYIEEIEKNNKINS